MNEPISQVDGFTEAKMTMIERCNKSIAGGGGMFTFT